MQKISDVYGYGTPSNRFVRPQSQATETFENERDYEAEERQMNQSMSQSMGDESESERPIDEYNSKPWKREGC